MREQTIEVWKKNMLQLKGGGLYETNGHERDYAALYFLTNYLPIISENMSCNAEPTGIMGEEILKLAKRLLDKYTPFIERGINIFAHDEWEREEVIQKLWTAYNEDRHYVVMWGEGYEPKEHVIVGTEFFTRDNGFTKDFMQDVIGMELQDERYDYSTGEITVVRIK